LTTEVKAYTLPVLFVCAECYILLTY